MATGPSRSRAAAVPPSPAAGRPGGRPDAGTPGRPATPIRRPRVTVVPVAGLEGEDVQGRLDRRGVLPEQARSVWSRPDRLPVFLPSQAPKGTLGL
jgi:hypothetical protein